ncbi:MAG: acyltransferase family protein, partial [Acetatifactor sp.]
ASSRIFGNYTVQMAYNYPFTVVLALLLFGLGLNWQKNGKKEKRNTGFWEKAGALCFAVYLIHPVFLNIYYKFLHISPLDFRIWISLPLFFLAALLPAFLAAWILRKVPVLKKYVL